MSSNTGNTILALITGAAIGAGIGILFAPDKGSNTRRKIRKGVEEASDNLNEALYEVSDKLVEKVYLTKDDLEQSLDNLVSNASHKTEDVISFLEEKLAALKLKNAKFQK
ncbi:Gas vesicle protein [Flavobacterium succinicans]|jgi:gas vesicle protein|uniref:Gas vesicle protein n=1 Tax=Flavobacterium succinicans TaxID=29536 RepID=A0A1I4QX33_9FLAO|nr:YtxH domain-containing protein [Flavobacterium succinicans]SFM44571.1 Gas vesicle protein [Flavobacterium succinicans]